MALGGSCPGFVWVVCQNEFEKLRDLTVEFVSATLRLMKRQYIVFAVVALLVLAASYFLFFKPDKTPKVDKKTLSGEVEKKVEEKFGLQIPDDLDKAELTGTDGIGVATRKYENGNFELNLLADLPDLGEGFYEAWINKSTEFVPLGKLVIGKGGWMLDYQLGRDLTDYKKVVVSVETGTLGKTPSKVVLEGAF